MTNVVSPTLGEFPPAPPIAAFSLSASAKALYAVLFHAGNRNGHVLRRTAPLATELHVSEEEIARAVEELAAMKLVMVLSPPPYLTLRLRFWPSSPDSARQIGESHSYSPIASMNLSFGDRGQGEGDSLPDQLRAVLPGVLDAEIKRILARYPTQVLARTLALVRNTPPDRIRKSKTAYFRYLLGRFSKAPNTNDR